MSGARVFQIEQKSLECYDICPMSTILFQAFAKSDWLGRLILTLLVFLSVYSWSILVQEFLKLRRDEEDTERFLDEYRGVHDDPLALYRNAEEGDEPDAAVIQVYRAGCRRLQGFIRDKGREGKARIGMKEILDIEDAMTLAISRASLGMEMRLGALATISSVSPLMGLFGTVWGIMLAFHSMGITGTTSIRTVAPGLTVALVTTVTGLAVAIPAMVGHNLLAARVRVAASRLKAFALDFLGHVEVANR